MRDQVGDLLRRLQQAIADIDREALEEVGRALLRAYRHDKQVFTAGNGGSSSTASHMAADLAKNTIGPNMKRFRISSICDNASIVTALANDIGYSSVFSEQLLNVITAGDVLIVVSASGNSPNILRSIELARRESAEVIGLLGCGGGAAAELVDVPIVVNSNHQGIVEDVHLVINHILVEYFKQHLTESLPCVACPRSASRRTAASVTGDRAQDGDDPGRGPGHAAGG